MKAYGTVCARVVDSAADGHHPQQSENTGKRNQFIDVAGKQGIDGEANEQRDQGNQQVFDQDEQPGCCNPSPERLEN